MKTGLIALWTLMCLTGAGAQDAAPPKTDAVSVSLPDNGSAVERETQRQQLAARRQQLETDYNEAMKLCYQKFDVTSCRLDARERRLQANAVLRKDEISFNTVDRRLRAEEAERRSAENDAAARDREQNRQTEAADNAKALADRAAQKQADHAARGQQREAYDQKQREAAQRRADLEQKRRERAKPAAALPLPGTAP
jgi:hypothetical protein